MAYKRKPLKKERLFSVVSRDCAYGVFYIYTDENQRWVDVYKQSSGCTSGKDRKLTSKAKNKSTRWTACTWMMQGVRTEHVRPYSTATGCVWKCGTFTVSWITFIHQIEFCLHRAAFKVSHRPSHTWNNVTPNVWWVWMLSWCNKLKYSFMCSLDFVQKTWQPHCRTSPPEPVMLSISVFKESHFPQWEDH